MSTLAPDPSIALNTLVELLHWRAHHQPNQLAYRFLLDGEADTVEITYAELDRQARAISTLLPPNVTGQRVLLLYAPGIEYIAAFFGCLYAGAIAVPAYPPQSARMDRTLPRRLRAIVQDAQPLVALTTRAILPIGEALAAHDPIMQRVHWLPTDDLAVEHADEWRMPAIDGAALAFLQYTSGSTATPKGVMLTHGNLLHNSKLIQHGIQSSADSQGVIWLPPYHDMGLIGGILQPLYAGFPVTLMSPLAFLQRPMRWLEAISRYRGTISAGPNFAYDLCARKITPEQRATLDLRSWQVALNGAEPIRPDTLERFTAAFAPAGFRREVFYPCYGLAEATLIVSGGAMPAAPIVRAFASTALERHEVIAPAHEAEARPLVGCGQSLIDQQIAIVNPHTCERSASDEVGEIWVAGPSVAQGYWDRPETTAQTFGARIVGSGDGPFLRTGDLGFLHNGELFVTGRLKDLIIIRGRNHYPQDIELTIEQSHPALRPGCGAAFAIDIDDEERLVVVQEVERQHRRASIDEVAAAVRQAVAEQHEVQIHALVLLKTGSLPKTSSGKIQRHACKEGFLSDTLDVIASSILDETAVVAAPADDLDRETLAALPDDRRQARLVAYLQSQVARVLRIDPAQVQPQQPISALGLDSLGAVELQHTIEASLGVIVSMTSFLQGASPVDLADEIARELGTPGETALALVPNTEEQRLSPGQRALWLLHQLAPDSAAYNIPSAARIRGQIDLAALERAFQQLCDRHPMLRATFSAPRGEPLPHIHEQPVSFTVEDAAGWSEAMLEERLLVESHRPFDLARGPVARVRIFVRSEQEHVLLFVVHHIVADLWSLAVLTEELGLLYAAETQGVSALLPPLHLRYTDYVYWQQRMLAGASGERLWRYWQQQVADAPTVLNLPTDRPRPPVQTYRGGMHAFALSAALTRRIKALAEVERATLYTTLLAAFGVLLYRYTDQDDILIGSPTAGRNRAELASLIGYFVNPIVLRARLAGNPSFQSLLAQVRQTTLDAFEHQDYPFVTLVERLQPIRDLSRSPLFQVMFAWQKAHVRDHEGLTAFALGEPGSRMNVGGLEFESLALEQRVAQFDLSLAMGEAHDRLAASLEYNADLFDAATIERMATHLTTLLDAIVADPTQPIADLPLLGADERAMLLDTWNGTACDIRAACVHSLFEAQAARTPAATAVIYEEHVLSYGELNARANQLAHTLRGLGVGGCPQGETLVGLCVERSLDLMVGVLGVLKAGGAYVPIDPAYPQERIEHILRDAGATLLLTQSQLREDMPTAARVLCLDSDWPTIADKPVQNPANLTMPTNAACVIYTSGSTGRPKGVVIQHDNIANLVASFERSYQPGTDDRMLPLTSLASASFVGEIFPPLCTGGALVLPNTVEALDFELLFTLIARHNVSIVSTVPAMMARLNAQKDALPRLRLILSGGEALALGEIDRLLTTTTIANGYGLTETTICSTFYHLEPDRAYASGNIPIGRPVINTQVYILDRQLQPRPVGQPGELYVGGAGIARGYLHHPDLTAARFVPHPFAAGERLYRTGDLARWLPEGQIEYLGRIDHQVKIRGFRIELGEIEAVLGQHPAVREAVVVVREDTPPAGGHPQKRLVGYVVQEQGNKGTREQKNKDAGALWAWAPGTKNKGTGHAEPETWNAEPETWNVELRTYLKDRLPDYMLPAAFVVLDALPLTPNGKVDRGALPVPDALRPELSADYVAPRSEVERTIAAVWQEALNLPTVGIHDNFFDLGGHSLLLVQVHSKLRESFAELALIDLFRYPTISALTNHLSTSGQAQAVVLDEFQERARKQRETRDRRKRLLSNS
ncbi:MAG TPA: amino acid adenylation domain-containing protein [Herpetosiphonaceae bacterium]